MTIPRFSDVEAAAARLRGHAFRTPLLRSAELDAMTGARVFVKAECLQLTGSFKFRGAFNAASALDEAQRKGGLVACSSGNHAQGVAEAARLLGMKSVIVMPSDAPAIKVARTRRSGAEVVLYDRASEDRDAIAGEIVERTGAHFIHPYENPFVIAGQGTCGLEIGEDLAAMGLKADRVIVCCGGGGLTAGVALAIHARFPDAVVHTAEPAGFDDYARSLAQGSRVTQRTAFRLCLRRAADAIAGRNLLRHQQRTCALRLRGDGRGGIRGHAHRLRRTENRGGAGRCGGAGGAAGAGQGVCRRDRGLRRFRRQCRSGTLRKRADGQPMTQATGETVAEASPYAFAARMALLYSAMFSFAGLMLPYFPLWLKDRGLDSTQIAMVLSLPLAVRVLTSGYVSAYADRARDRADILIALMAGTALCFAAFPFVGGFWPILGVALVLAFFSHPLQPVMDSITLSGVRRFGHDYGRIRMWGSVVFIIANFLGGWLLGAYGTTAIMTAMIATAFLGLAVSPVTPRLGRPRRAASQIQIGSASTWKLMANRRFMLVTAGCGIIQATHAMIYGFGSIHWEALGFSGNVIGLFWAIGVLAEIALFQFSRQVFRRVTPLQLAIIGGIACTLRWTLFPLEPGLAGYGRAAGAARPQLRRDASGADALLQRRCAGRTDGIGAGRGLRHRRDRDGRVRPAVWPALRGVRRQRLLRHGTCRRVRAGAAVDGG